MATTAEIEKKYDSLYDQYATAADASTKQKVDDSNASYTAKLKEAYIKNEQDKRALQENLASQGIRGGASETSNIKLATNYGNTRNSLNTEMASAARALESENEQNKLSYKLENDAAKLSAATANDQYQDTLKQQEFENNLAQEQWNAEKEESQYSRNYQQYLSAYSTKNKATLQKLVKKMKKNGTWDVNSAKCQAINDAIASK